MTTEATIPRVNERLPAFRAVEGAVFFRADRASGRVIDFRGDADTILGFDPDEWLAPGFMASRVLPSDRRALERIGDWRPGILEARLVRADGRVIWVERTLSARDGTDPVLDGVLADIDARVAREISGARARSVMSEALQSTHHEIRGPLKTISDFGKLLERHLAAQEDDVGSDYALGVREGVERLRALTEKLATAARLGGGR